MAGPKDKRKKKEKDYSKEQKAINKKWVKRMKKTQKALGLTDWKYYSEPTKTAFKKAGTMVTAVPFGVGMMGEKAIRAAKKKITGKSKGGSVKLAKKYFKGGMV
jgi:hypothetical protein